MDYINETTTSRSSINSYSTGAVVSAEDVLEQHKKDIKLDIVARFNAAQRAGACLYCKLVLLQRTLFFNLVNVLNVFLFY